MAFQPPKTQKPPRIQRTDANNWLKGIVTAFDAGRMPIDGLLSATNVMLDQNGTVTPRPSLSEYGPQPVGKVLGQVFEYKKAVTGGFEQWMISMQEVAGVGNIYIARGEDTSWTKIATKDYDDTATTRFFQIQNKVMIMNGTDHLSYFDIDAGSIVSYTQLTDTSSPTLDTKTGFGAGTDFKVYYSVTANSSVGETKAPTPLQVPVSQDRNTWDSSTQSVKIQWTTVTGVKSWNVYIGISADGAGEPTMYAIATGLDASTLSFTDNGTYARDLARPAPTQNSTAGPKARRGTVIDGRAWMTGDTENRYHVWRGGDYGYELDFSPANGGGFTSIGNGTKEVPVDVKGFRDGQGASKITVLTQSTNGMGKRYLLSPRELSYGSYSFIVWESKEDSGDDGTDSPDGVVVYNNSLWYPSRDGFKTTGTKPQLQNVLSTDRISNTIQPDISLLNTGQMNKAVGVAHEGKIYWALPVGDTKNNQIWVLDIDRQGAWMKWVMPAEWIWLYNDNTGVTRFLLLKDDKIYRLNKMQRTADNGVGFNTSGSSGQIPISEDGMEWARLIDVTFRLSRPQGKINFTVAGYTEDGIQTWARNEVYGVTTTVAGWGEPSAIGMKGFGRHAWGGTETPPKTTGQVTRDIKVEVDEDVQWWSFSWDTIGSGVAYQMSNVVAQHVNIGVKNTD